IHARLAFAAPALASCPSLLHYLRHANNRFSPIGPTSNRGAVTDRFGVGNNFDALAFAPGNHGYGPNLFYYLRRDSNGFSTFGTIDTSGAVTDHFGVGNNVDALAFAPGNHGDGPNLFYYLRRDITGLTLTAPNGTAPYSRTQQGYYMMFVLNNNGVPSIATWIYVH